MPPTSDFVPSPNTLYIPATHDPEATRMTTRRPTRYVPDAVALENRTAPAVVAPAAEVERLAVEVPAIVAEVGDPPVIPVTVPIGPAVPA